MNILAIDTSGKACTVALLHYDIYSTTKLNGFTHSVNLLPIIDEVLKNCFCDIDDIDLIICVGGPGSFTGVRIGISTVKGLAHKLDIPCVVLNSLETLSVLDKNTNKIICPILDARAGQVYGSAFKYGLPPLRLVDDTAIKLTDYIDIVKNFGESFIFVGDGVVKYKDEIINLLGDKAEFLEDIHLYSQGKNIIKLGMIYKDKAQRYSDIEPIYLRASQAERNWCEKNKL